MSSLLADHTEKLIRFSRRQLWCALVFLVLLGGAHLADGLFHLRLPAAASAMMLVCVVIVAATKNPRATKGVDFSSGSPAMQALRNDELRQFAQAKAFRNGFCMLLAYPPICAFVLTGLGFADPLPFVVGSGAWSGGVVFLASLLWYDR